MMVHRHEGYENEPVEAPNPVAPCGRARGGMMGVRRLAGDQRGVAAVEFGLVSIIMFMMMAGAFDLSQRILFQRDLKRFTTSVALTLANCPEGGGTCTVAAIRQITDRMQLLLPGVATRELRMVSFLRQNDKIVADAGLTTYLQPGEEISAKALLTKENDRGVLASVKATHDPLFPSFAAKWGMVSNEFDEQTMQLSHRAQ